MQQVDYTNLKESSKQLDDNEVPQVVEVGKESHTHQTHGDCTPCGHK